MLKGAQRCSSVLARHLVGRSAALTQSQILPASLAPLAVLRHAIVTDNAPAGVAYTAYHSFPSQGFHSSVSLAHHLNGPACKAAAALMF